MEVSNAVIVQETIAHLFFDCHLARLVWRIIHTTFGIHRPKSIMDMFGSWLLGIKGDIKNCFIWGWRFMLGHLALQK